MPYAMGENFTLADVLTYPWIERWVVLGHYLDFNIDEKFKKIHEWTARVQERETIKASRQTDEFHINGYKSYFSEWWMRKIIMIIIYKYEKAAFGDGDEPDSRLHQQ